MLLTVSLSLTFLLWYPTPDYHCSVVGPVSTVCDGSWICCSCCCYLILPTFICLCSPYFFHLLSCVLGVAICHVIFSIFVIPLLSLCWLLCHFYLPQTNSHFFPFLFPLALVLVLVVYSKSMGTSIGKHCFLLPDNHWTGVLVVKSFQYAIFQLAQWQWWILLPFEVAKHQQVKTMLVGV